MQVHLPPLFVLALTTTIWTYGPESFGYGTRGIVHEGVEDKKMAAEKV
jgi:hypothetical protein